MKKKFFEKRPHTSQSHYVHRRDLKAEPSLKSQSFKHSDTGANDSDRANNVGQLQTNQTKIKKIMIFVASRCEIDKGSLTTERSKKCESLWLSNTLLSACCSPQSQFERQAKSILIMLISTVVTHLIARSFLLVVPILNVLKRSKQPSIKTVKNFI